MPRTKIPTIDIKKYGGKKVILFREQVLVSGRDTTRLLERAKRLVPSQHHGELWLFTVPKGLTIIYRMV